MKKGFTLVELLAVIVIVAVISTVVYGIVSKNIEETKKKSFETSVQNLLEATKEYVVSNFEENDFPEGGIDVVNSEINVKNDKFISGLIDRDDEGVITATNVTDGNYCANGSKNDLEIIKGSCEASDTSKPTVSLKLLKASKESLNLLIKIQDAQSGIKEYSYCYSSSKTKEICKNISAENERSQIKKVLLLNNLNANTEYSITIKATNNSRNSDTESFSITETASTLEIDVPKFSITSNSYTSTKVLTITYPEKEKNSNYEYKYQLKDGELVNVEENKVSMEISSNTVVRASIYKNGSEVIYDEINIDGIDVKAPVVNVKVPKLNEWTTSKEVTVNAIDEGVGLAIRSYSYNNGEEWLKENTRTYTSNQTMRLRVRDRLGNASTKFTINDDKNEYDEYTFENIDDEGPNIKIDIIEGTKMTDDNEWYSSSRVVAKVTIIDEVKKIDSDGKEIITEGGCGVNANTVSVKLDNSKGKIEKINDLEYRVIITDNGLYNITATAKDNLGNQKTKEIKKTIKKDDVQPTITAKPGTHYISLNQSANPIAYFNVSSYGVAGGTTTCYFNNKVITNINTLALGINEVNCKMIGNNGKKAETNVTLRHQYSAKVNCNGGRSVSGGNCAYTYNGNCGKCGNYCTGYRSVCESCTRTRSYTYSCSQSYTCQTGIGSYQTCSTCRSCHDQGFIDNSGVWHLSPICTTYTCNCSTVYYPIYGTCYRQATCTGTESYYDACCSTRQECNGYACSTCTLNENEYRYYTCETKGNNGSVGSLNGSVCYF